MSNTATQTYQQGVQNLQAWIDFLTGESERVQSQLRKMQGGGSPLPQIDADLPYGEEEGGETLPAFLRDEAEEETTDKWL